MSPNKEKIFMAEISTLTNIVFPYPLLNAVLSSTESIRFLGPKVWDADEIQCGENLRDFKIVVKNGNQHYFHE